MSRQSIQAGKAVIVIDLADQATAKFSKLVSNMSAKMMQASRALRDTSLNATAGFVLSQIAVRGLIKDFVSFEDKILNLTVKMGFFGNKTAEQTAIINDLEQTIMQLGRTTAFTSQEVADAAISLAQAGFSAEELKSSLQGVLDLARGTNYSLGESADFVANLIRTYNMFGADDSLEQKTAKVTRLTSQLVASTRLGTIEIVDLREAFKYAAGKAAALGIEIETLMAYFIQMSESGLKASLAGTSLNTMMSNLSNNLAKIQKYFPKFQITLTKTGKVDLLSTQKQLLKLTESMDFLKRTSFFQEVFNMRGERAFAASVEVERIKAFEQAIKRAGAESRLAAAVMESGAGGAVRRFTSALETLRITIVKLYSKEFTGLVNGLAFLVTVVERFIANYKGLTLALLTSPVIFGAVAVGAMTLSFVLARLARALRLVSAAGHGLKFLGGGLLGAAKGTAAMFGPKGPSRAAQIATQMKAVAKLQTKIQAMSAKALTRKTTAGQAKAMAGVANSKTMQKLVAASQKLQTLQKLPPNSLLGLLSRFGQTAKQVIPVTQKMAAAVGKAGRAFVARQKAIKTNALMNSAIRGEQMIALKQERAMQAQIAKASTPIKPGVAQKAAMPGMSAKRASQLKAINSTLINIAANEGRLARFAAIQERTYDRLYKVRKEIAALEAAKPEQIVGAKAGKRTPLTQQALRQQEIRRQAKLASLRAREAKMAAIVNRNVGPQQTFFAKQRERVQKVFNAKQKVAGIEQARAQAGVQRSLDAKAATKTAASRTRQAATLKRLEIAQRGQRVASEMKIATLRSRLTNVKGAGSIVGGGLMKGLSALKGGGIAAFKGIFNMGTLGKVVTSVNAIALGFLKVAGSVTRFVFSWNFVGMIFNILLLFGDKIPPVVQAFQALGRGISGAFGELGKIANYAAPALQLFQLAIEAFMQGDISTGVFAISSAFSGIADIISNQIMAAWNTFMANVDYLWVTLMKVFTALKSIFMSIFEGVSQTAGVIASPIFNSFKDVFSMFSGGGKGGIESRAFGFTVGLDKFITELFRGAIFLHEQLMKFLAAFQSVIGQIISRIPGMGAAGRGIQMDASVTSQTAFLESKRARKELETQRARREQELSAMFATNTAGRADQRRQAAAGYNAQSQQSSFNMSRSLEIAAELFEANMQKRAAEIARLQQERDSFGDGKIPQSTGQGAAWLEQLDQMQSGLQKYLQSVTGSAMSTRSIYRVDTKTQEQLMKDQLDEQRETNRLLSTGAGMP
jgi:TP901 family phage tail tape measure protein